MAGDKTNGRLNKGGQDIRISKDQQDQVMNSPPCCPKEDRVNRGDLVKKLAGLTISFKTKKSVPYRFVAPRLWPTNGREHLGQSVAGLPLDNNIAF